MGEKARDPVCQPANREFLLKMKAWESVSGVKSLAPSVAGLHSLVLSSSFN